MWKKKKTQPLSHCSCEAASPMRPLWPLENPGGSKKRKRFGEVAATRFGGWICKSKEISMWVCVCAAYPSICAYMIIHVHDIHVRLSVFVRARLQQGWILESCINVQPISTLDAAKTCRTPRSSTEIIFKHMRIHVHIYIIYIHWHTKTTFWGCSMLLSGRHPMGECSPWSLVALPSGPPERRQQSSHHKGSGHGKWSRMVNGLV